MAKPVQFHRVFIILAAVVLIATSAMHLTGYWSVSKAIQSTAVEPFLVSAVKALWLMFSAHLIILGVVVILVSDIRRAKWVVLACALMPAFDTALLLCFVGLFVGTFALAAAALLLLVGGWLQFKCDSRNEDA